MSLIFNGLCNFLVAVGARWQFHADIPAASAVFKGVTQKDFILLSLRFSLPKANFR